MTDIDATAREAKTPAERINLAYILGLIERATGPSEEIDEAIALLTDRMERVLVDPYDGGTWIEVAPKFTARLDLARSLVPPGWHWQVGQTSCFEGWANVYEKHPDHTDPEINEFHCNSDRWSKSPTAATPELCLIHAALRALASKAGRSALGERDS